MLMDGIQNIIYTVFSCHNEVEHVEHDDYVPNATHIYLKDGQHFTVRVTKTLTYKEANEIYQQLGGPPSKDVLRSLTEQELLFLSEVVEAEREEDILWHYSGRGMYGRETLAVRGQPFSCPGLDLACDDMGLGVVTYVRD